MIPRGKATSTRTPIYIILYCRPDMVATLAKYLMSQRVVLKTPPFYNPECHLYNPHAFMPDQLSYTQSPHYMRSSEHDTQRQHQKDIQTLLESIPHEVPSLKKKRKRQQDDVIEITSDDDIRNRVEYDIWYLENWDEWLDLRIMFLTVYNMIKGEEKAY